MKLLLKIVGTIIVAVLPVIFLVVSMGTGNFRYFFYALSAALAAVITFFIMKRLVR
jgi:hypothetical protein